MISGVTHIQKDFDPTMNFWEINPQLIYINPFSDLYSNDKSKNKEQSSKDMWCILWMNDPDEDVNKFYRIPKEERIETCKNFNKTFDPQHPLIEECSKYYTELCLSADEKAYKLQKDQLIEIAQYLNTLPLDLDTIGKIVDLKSKMPKIYKDFETVDKLFQKVKSEQRVFGGRRQTSREQGRIIPD
jgi:hypothetical protein